MAKTSSCSALIALIVSAICMLSLASSFDKPHAHRGKVVPYEPGDPGVELDAVALQTLKKKLPYQTQIQSGASGRGLCVQDVEAPASIVWEKILDFNNYSNMVPSTLASSNYNVVTNKDGSQLIYTRMKIGFSFVKLEFFVRHVYVPKLNSLTWTLDYDKTSDFDDSVGFWFIIPHPDNKDWARVYYSVGVSMFDWVPGFVMDIMSSKALTDATGWVKRESELEIQNKVSDLQPGITKKKKGIFSIFQRKNRNADEEESRKATIFAAEQAAAEKAARDERNKRARTASIIVIGLVFSNVILSFLVWRGISKSSSS